MSKATPELYDVVIRRTNVFDGHEMLFQRYLAKRRLPQRGQAGPTP